MTRDNLDERLERWMRDGPEDLPQPALDRALARAAQVQQRGAGSRRQRGLATSATGSPVPLWASVAAVLAAIVVTAVAASALLRPNVGSEEDPTPVATPAGDPLARPLEPEAIIPIPAAFFVSALGGDVWFSSQGELVRLNAATHETTAVPLPSPIGAWGGVAATEDAVWTADYNRGRVYRVDPTTMEVVAEIELGPNPNEVTAAPEGIWVRTAGDLIWDAHRIDPLTNEVAATVEGGNALAYGQGSLWFGQRGADRVIRADPETGESVAVIEVPRGNSCAVSALEASVWTYCFLGQGTPTVTRIDPATNEVVATVDIDAEPLAGLIEIDGDPWVIALGDDGGQFIRIDLVTNQVARRLIVGPEFDPDEGALADDALFVPNDGEGEVYRFDLGAFREE